MLHKNLGDLSKLFRETDRSWTCFLELYYRWEQDDSHRFSVSEKNNSRVEPRNCFFGPFSMTYLLELTIMKIYWDHKFAESLWSVTRTEQTINQLRIDKVSLELMHGKNGLRLRFADKIWMNLPVVIMLCKGRWPGWPLVQICFLSHWGQLDYQAKLSCVTTQYIRQSTLDTTGSVRFSTENGNILNFN